ncbi:50S ribosomal protein L7/L12 [Thermostilla marina]
MATDAPAREFSEAIKELGDRIVALSLKEAKELSDYLEEVHGIKAAAGGVVMAAPAGGDGGAGDGGAAEEKTEFDVVLESFGDKKLKVITAVRSILAGIPLTEAKKLVESAPATIKEGVPKEEAEQIKEALEKEGATVTIK